MHFPSFIVIFHLSAMSVYSLYTDRDLMEKLANGDQKAFSEIYSRNWEYMYKSAYSILKDPNASKDIVQDIFIWLWEHRSSVKIQTLKSYLKTAVKFKVVNYIRSGNIRQSFFEQMVEFSSDFSTPSHEELLELKQLKEIIQQAVGDLPSKCQEIFRLSREGYLSNREIADKLSISIKTVENQMTTAIRRVREAIEPHATSGFIIFFICHYLSF